jgi:hypothetical protein
MKKINKKLVEKLIIIGAPLFTLIMYLLPWVCIYKERYIWKSVISEAQPLYKNYFSILSVEGFIFSKIIMWLSLIGLIVCITLYVMTFFVVEKENQFLKVGNIILVASTGILFLTTLRQLFTEKTFTGGEFSSWVEFMTVPYALLLIYNVTSLIYLYKKKK